MKQIRIAHISDLHIVSPGANLRDSFLDFLLLAGPPTALYLLLKPVLEDPKKRNKLLKKLFLDKNDNPHPLKIAAAVGISIPAAYFILRQIIRLKRIFYLAMDSETRRNLLFHDMKKRGITHAVFTGDITNTALADEFKKAKEYFNRISSFAKVTVIPGNHDVNVFTLPVIG
ncbi:MAG: metallophosphoesterase, partial [Bacteroidota bacterium]